MKRFIEYLYYSNLWIAAGAAALAYSTVLSYAMLGDFTALLVLVFFSTLFTYSLHRLYPVLMGGRNPQDNQHLKWIWAHRIEGIAVLMLSAYASVYIFLYFLSFHSQLLLFLTGMITVLYSIPIFPQKEGPKMRLRDFPYIKIFLIGLIFSLSCVALPWLESERLIPLGSLILSMLEKFLFLIAITIPFDIRDYAYDKAVDVDTIPQKFGFSRSIDISLFLCLLCILLVWLNHLLLSSYSHSGIPIGLSLSYIVTAYAIKQTTPYRGDWFYLGVLDGMLILPLLCLLLLK